MTDKELMQRAWDSLAVWKETYPEGWDEDDERLLDDLITRLAQPQREWVGLTEAERVDILDAELTTQNTEHFALAQAIEAKLKEKNNG